MTGVMEALVGVLWMILIVGGALAAGIIIGKIVVRYLKRKRAEEPVCQVTSDQMEELSLSILRLARASRIESEQLDRDLRGAANV